MKRYLFTEIVDKVFHYTQTPTDTNYYSLITLAKIIEENRLKIHQQIHNVKKELNFIQDSINGNTDVVDQFSCLESWSSRVGKESMELDASVRLANRTRDFLFPKLKEILMPVWKVYWNEGCNSFVSISMWLELADNDEGKKVKIFLQSL